MGVSSTVWKAELSLVFRRDGERSILAERRHEGPLIVQKPLYPEGPGVCQIVLVHAPGGIAGGDSLTVNMALDTGAHALLTTPSATKWYKANGRMAHQTARLDIADQAILEWLPGEAIIFDQANAAIASRVSLAGDAVYAGWEISCLGRRASGEAFEHGYFRQSQEIRRAGALIWNDRIAFEGGDRMLTSPVGLGGKHVFGSMAVAKPGTLPVELLDACRELTPQDGEGRVTALPDIVSVRYLGASAEQARHYFEALRGLLRPWYAGRPAHPPRLWAT
jgi:urease accessory protein